MTADEWHVIGADGKPQGPYSRAALFSMLSAGTIGRSTLVWSAGMQGWQSLDLAFKGQLPPPASNIQSQSANAPIAKQGSAGCLQVFLFLIALIVLASIALPAYNNYLAKHGRASGAVEQAAVTQPPPDPKSKVDPGIFEPYDKSQYPRLAKTLGKAWSRLQQAREAAALHVASNPKCDYVELAEAADRTTAKEIVFFVDCRNGERMYVAESNLKSGSQTAFQSQNSVDRTAAMSACREGILKTAAFPSSVDIHVLTGTAFDTNKTTGNTRVRMDFTAKNALGAELSYTAICIFPGDGSPPEITIKLR